MEMIYEKCGTPTESNWPGVTLLKNYSQLIPRKHYTNKLRSYYIDNKK